MTMPSYYEFFAGGGMVRAGLGQGWCCLFANDFDHKKGRIYRENWKGGELKTADVGSLTTKDLPGVANLAWASFPCQDLSLAGGGAGLKGDRSGTFWPFWNLMKGVVKENRAPRLIVLENVCGTLTSHDGKDFATICGGFQQAGYAVGHHQSAGLGPLIHNAGKPLQYCGGSEALPSRDRNGAVFQRFAGPDSEQTMIAAILRAQLLSLRLRSGRGYSGAIFSVITSLFFYGIWGMLAWAGELFFSSPESTPYLMPVLSGGLLFVMGYWQLAPVVSASFGASLDMRKLLLYPIPRGQLFAAEVILRITLLAGK